MQPASVTEGAAQRKPAFLLDSAASIELFRKAGFRVLGRRARLGQMDQRWLDLFF